MKRLVLITVSLLMTGSLMAQKEERTQLRVGNRAYRDSSYTEAEVAYRKALEADPKSPQGAYNLGNTLIKQEKAQEALEQYQLALSAEENPMNQAAILHNIGNALMLGQDLAKAVEAFKQSLRLNPSDDETRYNLAMAQALLKQQEQQQQQQQNQQQDQQQQEDQQQDQQQQQEERQPNPQEEQNRTQELPEPQDQQQQKMTQEQAQQLLDALTQDEEELQEQVKKLQMQQGQRIMTDKDW